MNPRDVRRLQALRRFAAIAALLVPVASHALYKVIDAKGNVTFTDRAPVAVPGARITPLSAAGTATTAEASLPLELRQAVTRYPVTLYTTTECEPCDAARQLLRQRGIPHAERQVQTGTDAEALQKLSGGREAPTLMIGSQALRGFLAELWQSYLDSAGYPRESRLPPNYQPAAATPMTERRDTGSPARRPGAEPEPAAEEPAEPASPGAAPGGIRF